MLQQIHLTVDVAVWIFLLHYSVVEPTNYAVQSDSVSQQIVVLTVVVAVEESSLDFFASVRFLIFATFFGISQYYFGTQFFAIQVALLTVLNFLLYFEVVDFDLTRFVVSAPICIDFLSVSYYELDVDQTLNE